MNNWSPARREALWAKHALEDLDKSLQLERESGCKGTLLDFGEDVRDRLATYALACRNRADDHERRAEADRRKAEARYMRRTRG